MCRERATTVSLVSNLKALVLWLQPVIHNIRLPKQSTVGDVLNEIKTKV